MLSVLQLLVLKDFTLYIVSAVWWMVLWGDNASKQLLVLKYSTLGVLHRSWNQLLIDFTSFLTDLGLEKGYYAACWLDGLTSTQMFLCRASSPYSKAVWFALPLCKVVVVLQSVPKDILQYSPSVWFCYRIVALSI